MPPTSTRKSSSRTDLPTGVREHGRWYQKRPHRGAKWENISETDDGPEHLRKVLAQRAAKDTDGDLPDRVPETLTELMARAITQKEREGVAEKTIKGYRDLAEGLIVRSKLAAMPWKNVTRPMVIALLEATVAAGRSTSGNAARAVISLAYSYAIYKEWSEYNPCQNTKKNPKTSALTTPEHRSRAESFQTKYVPKTEFLEVYSKLNEWHQDVLACAYLIGVRQADLLHLKRDSIRDGAIFIKERKTGRSTRKAVKILMGPDVAFHVKRAFARQDIIASRPCEVLRPRSAKVARRLKHWPISDYVFCNADNQRVTQSAIRNAIVRAGGKFDFRDIRATVVTDDEAEKAESGLPAKDNILGHDKDMLGVYQKHEVKRSDTPGRGSLPEALGVSPKLRVIQGRKL